MSSVHYQALRSDGEKGLKRMTEIKLLIETVGDETHKRI